MSWVVPTLPAVTVPPVMEARRSGPWSPLRITIYRSLWIAGLVSNIGTFMHLVAANWSMTTMTDSPTVVSLVQVAWSIPGFLLALHAGAFADRLDRRAFLVVTQIGALVVAGGLAVLDRGGWLTPAWLLAGTFLESIALTMAAPAFMALTPALVGAGRLQQAIGLDAISRNAAQAIGPAIAGGVIAWSGPGAVFAMNAASFVGVVVVVQRSSLDRREVAVGEALGGAIREGVQRVRSNPQLRRPVVRLAVTSALGAGFTALLPLVARGRLAASAGGFGALSAGFGIGSVAAVWSLPRLRAADRPERAIGVAAATWSIGVAVFAVGRTWAVALPAVVLAGVGAMGMLNVLVSNYMLQLEEWMRGRGSAIAMLMVWLGASVGALAAGAMASGVGLSAALLTIAIGNIGWCLIGASRMPIRPLLVRTTPGATR